MTRDEAERLVKTGELYPGMPYHSDYADGAYALIEALDAAGAFTVEPTCTCEAHDAGCYGTQIVPDENPTCPVHWPAEPAITKAQAYEVARLCALSGGRHYWDEPEFEKAWAAVTGAKP